MALVVLLIHRVDVGNRAVAVPLEECNIGIFCLQLIHNVEHIVLHLGVAQVEHELVAEVVFLAVGKSDYPVLVLLVKFRLGVHHLRLNPEAEFHALLLGFVGETSDAIGELIGSLLPVAKSLCVAVTRILVAKPAIIEKEHIHTKLLCFANEGDELILIEVEVGRFPVVEKRHAVAHTVFHLVAACPVVQVAACLAVTVAAKREDELRCAEALALCKAVAREIGVDSAQHAQIAGIVHLEGEAEVTGPAKCSHKHLTAVLGGRSPE